MENGLEDLISKKVLILLRTAFLGGGGGTGWLVGKNETKKKEEGEEIASPGLSAGTSFLSFSFYLFVFFLLHHLPSPATAEVFFSFLFFLNFLLKKSSNDFSSFLFSNEMKYHTYPDPDDSVEYLNIIFSVSLLENLETILLISL